MTTVLDEWQGKLDHAVGLASKRAVYEALLDEFPLLMGYWIQYADLEKTNDIETCLGIYKRAVAAIPSSVTLWTTYMTCLLENTKDGRLIQSEFERAEANCGRDFYSHPLWDLHLKFAEESDLSGQTTATILKTVIKYPLHQYSRYFEQLSNLAARIPDVAADVRFFAETQKATNERWPFESKITQNYFHVLPLEKSQVDNWNSYLDFEENSGFDPDQTRNLYERASVPSALNTKFWHRYFQWAFSNDEKRDILRRGTKFTGSLDLKLLWAVFEESKGNLDQARDILDTALKLMKNDNEKLQIYTYRYNLERRAGNEAHYLKELNNEYAYGLAAQHADDPKQVLEDGLKKYPSSKYLHMTRLRLGFTTWKDLLGSPLPPSVIDEFAPLVVDKTVGTREWLRADYESFGPFTVRDTIKAKLADDGKISTTNERLKQENGHPGVQIDPFTGRNQESVFEKYIRQQQQELGDAN